VTPASPAPGVWRLGDALVNFYLVAEGTDLTLIDAGLPGHWDALLKALHELGRSVHCIRAVLVSHGHPDHFGLAERLRQVSDAQVWVHELDAPILRAPRRMGRWWRPERGLLGYVLRFGPGALRGPAHLLRRGALRLQGVRDLATFEHDQVLDVPGRPRVIHVPGHTAGSSAFLFEQQGLLFTGDALVTADAVLGRAGPRVLCRAFTQNSEQALRSLDRLAAANADGVLPGHGDPWRRGSAEAVGLARLAGIA
jgi:glyoxylase-like metal-dependent hydrolase (beta-lactamase superfamily II)